MEGGRRVNFSINTIVYFYIFICIALLLFNILYILRSEGKNRNDMRMLKRWNGMLDRILDPECEESADEAHRKLLVRRLRRTDELAAYNGAVEGRLDEPGTREYLDSCYDVFQELALYYGRRPPMERAFFSYLIARYRPVRPGGGGRLPVILLDYMESSTVYCRENVLQALCALGAAGGIEQALRLMNERGWYHHSRMLSDGLTAFRGDRAALAEQLWSICGDWNENLQLAVVQFATNVTDGLKGPFREALRDRETLLEVRFAIIRYFAHYSDPEAKPLLLDMARENSAEGGTAIAACSALARYPGEDTVGVLESALMSPNWYVRRNAASSLVALNGEDAAYAYAERFGDRYALDMLNYVTGRSVKTEVSA